MPVATYTQKDHFHNHIHYQIFAVYDNELYKHYVNVVMLDRLKKDKVLLVHLSRSAKRDEAFREAREIYLLNP